MVQVSVWMDSSFPRKRESRSGNCRNLSEITETSPPSFPRKRESKATGIYRKNRNFSAVVPAKAGIRKPKATGIYRKNRNFSAVIPAKAGIQSHWNLSEKPKLLRRHSRESGNPETQSHRNLSEITETPPPSFPHRRESRSVGAETYRIKRFLQILRSGFPLSWE